MTGSPLKVAIVGGGIAGLTAALAFAERGFRVRVFERAPQIVEVGAGLQISPNATRVLDRLGVLSYLSPAAVRPQALVLRNARSMRELATLPLRADSEKRWGAAYLTAHRADLQSALLAVARRHADIVIETGSEVRDAAFYRRGITLSVHYGGRLEEVRCDLAIGADGVWSTMRQLGGQKRPSRFTGYIAWRAMLRGAAEDMLPAETICAFLNSQFHLVAYPVRAGTATNLVAITRGEAAAERWSSSADRAKLDAAMIRANPSLHKVVGEAGPWAMWPIHEVPVDAPWTHPSGIALIGDAAHAMAPFAAQGAAMAIEDAASLAALTERSPNDFAAAFAAYERLRRERVKRVAKRGEFNRRAWHAGWPASLVRDTILASRPQEKLLADFDWLYAYDVEKAAANQAIAPRPAARIP